VGPRPHDHNSVKPKPIFKKFPGRFFGKFVGKLILKIPPHVAYVATLPCETLMSAKQGSVAIGVVGLLITKIKKGLLLSPWVKFFFKSVNI